MHTAEHFNLYTLMHEHALQHPGRLAFAQATRRDKAGRYLYLTRTYAQLLREVDQMAQGLRSVGLGQGSKTLLLIKPDIDLPVTVFALFKIGAVPIVIDPAMGLKRLLACIKQVEPQAMIALPAIHALRVFAADALRSVQTYISNGACALPRTHRLARLRHANPSPGDMADTLGSDLAAIFFTSGSTGTPKGVEALHKTLGAQIAHFGSMSGGDEPGVELAAFPVATLIGPCLGQTSVIPDMGSMHPGRCRPDNLVQTIDDFGITSGFASPIVWERLSRYGATENIRLPSIRRAFSGGAPIPFKMVRRLSALLPNGVMHTPYGTTEVTPISTIDANEISRDTAHLARLGHGTCVGRVVPGLQVQIIDITEQALPHWRDVRLMPPGAIGEIVVKGPLVSPRYHLDPVNTALSKIQPDEGDDPDQPWHRTGDTGYVDAQGRLWFCGRIRHIVQVDGQRYFSVQAEEILNAEPEVWRSALVGATVQGQTCLCVVVEFYPEHKAGITPERLQALRDKLDGLGFPVRHVLPYPHTFPVDKRHNSKIERHLLARWAQQHLGKRRAA